MGEPRHTPGPWVRADHDPYTIEREGAPVCVVHEAGDFPCWDGPEGALEAECEANARLIAAAPDLLAACELWDQGFVDGEEFTPEQLLAWLNANRRAARAAIAKAKGQ